MSDWEESYKLIGQKLYKEEKIKQFKIFNDSNNAINNNNANNLM